MNKEITPFLVALSYLFTQVASFAQSSESIFDIVTKSKSSAKSASVPSYQAPSSCAATTLNGQLPAAPAASAPSPYMYIAPKAGSAGNATSFGGNSYAQDLNTLPNGMTQRGMEALKRHGGQLSGSTNGGVQNSYPGQKMYPGIPGEYAPKGKNGSLMDWALPQNYRPGTAARQAAAKQPQGQKKRPWGWYPKEMDCGRCGTHHSLNDPCPICGYGYSNVTCTHSWYHED